MFHSLLSANMSVYSSFLQASPSDAAGMPSNASAQFFAGHLYAYQKQREDHREYLLGCSEQKDELDKSLESMYENYMKEDKAEGFHSYVQAQLFYPWSMNDCAET